MPCLARDNATHIRLDCLRKPICGMVLLRTKDNKIILHSKPWKLSTVEAFRLLREGYFCN